MISNLSDDLGRMERFMQNSRGASNGAEALNYYIKKIRHFEWLEALGLYETGFITYKKYDESIDLEV